MTTRVLSARRLALRGRLVLLFLLALLPAFAAGLYTTYEQRNRIFDDAADTVVRLARLTGAHFEGILESTYQVLNLLDDDPLVLAGGRACEARFAHVLAVANHNFTGFALGNEKGQALCSSPRTNHQVVLGRALYDRLAAGEDFVIGESELGPITGKPVLIAVAAIRDNGDLTRMVATGVDLRRLDELAHRAQLPPGAILSIVNHGGTILARFPDPASMIGRSVADRPEFQQIRDSRIPGWFETVSLDGVRRVWGYAPLEVGGARYFAAVGIAADHLMASNDHMLRDTLRGIGIAAVLALIVVALAGEFILRRPIERIRVTAERIAGGDLTARVGLDEAPGELGALARAIDDMAVDLQTRENRVASLSRHLLEVQEFERRALARELHDEIGQGLTALKLMLQRHRQTGGCQDTASIEELLDLSDRTLQQVRGLSLDLRPAMLDHLGLAETLRWYVDREAERAGFRAVCRIEPARVRLGPQLETTLFRIAQEALTNISRHAHATTVAVDLMSTEQGIELSIRDDGRGFDIASARARAQAGASLGLLGMEERAMLAGGVLRIVSGPSGTEVRATFPPVSDDREHS